MSEQVIENEELANLDMSNPDTLADLEDGFLRLRLTHKCNCKCEFCYQNHWSDEMKNAALSKELLYDYCRPLYSKIKTVLMGGGEVTFSKEGFNLCKFMSENYPQVNVITESNGILYDEKWQNLAVENLFITHFSLNAACGETYTKAVWPEGGKAVYDRVLGNIQSLAQKCWNKGMGCFAPSVSMVINHNSAGDVYDFIKLALSSKLKFAHFYFDQREGTLRKDHFLYPEILEPTLKMLMKIERVLATKFSIYFKLWLPLNCTEKFQAEVEEIPIEELREEFAELVELAKDRDVKKEWEERNKLRQEKGKKTLTFEEDYFTTLHSEQKMLSDGTTKDICFAPFKGLDIMADGTIILCSWTKRELNINDYIKNNTIDWAQLLNHPNFQDMRAKALKDDFSRCMPCCPLHPSNPHLNNFMEYGIKRKKP